MPEENDPDVVALTAQIVGAYIENNPVPASELPALIERVSGSVSGLSREPEPPPAVPAVSVKRSVKDDHVVCLEDGKKFKSLKRHLTAEHGMTAAEYRAKWNLPFDYPMVAPAYSAQRSQLAKATGLGRKVTRARGRRKASA